MRSPFFTQRRASRAGHPRIEPLEGRRLLSTGTFDQGFGQRGRITDSSLEPGQAMAVQSDGKIVVAGIFDSRVEVSRFNYDGTLDPSFGKDGSTSTTLAGTTTVSGVAIDSKGRIIVAGTNTGLFGGSNFVLVRFIADGRLDRAFNRSGLAITSFGGNDTAASVIVEPGNDIVVAGTKVDTPSGQSYFALARYTTTGALDSSFGTGGEVLTSFAANATGQAVAYDGGDLVVAGSLANGAGAEFAVARYTSGGQLDDSFNTGGESSAQVGASDASAAVAILGDGVVVVGCSADGVGTLAAFNADGAVDSGFGNNGIANLNGGSANSGGQSSGINSLAVESDGKLLAAGFFTSDLTTQFAVARFATSGVLDANFGSILTPNRQPMTLTTFLDNSGASAMALSPDGRIVAAGGASELDLERLLNDVGGTDATPPTAMVSSAKRLRRATARPYEFTVTFSDNVAVNAATLGNKNILVIGPGGFSEYAVFVDASPDVSDASLSATYEIAAPRKDFRATNNGVYMILLKRRQVRDTNGNPVMAGELGAFSVHIP